MAKKKTSKKNKKVTPKKVVENALPQNILQVGERVEESKNIYISQQVYREIHKFTQNKTTNESGGVLIGSIIEEFGKTNIVIKAFIEAKYCEATPTTLKFTHKTWEYCHKEMERKYPGEKIVGWIHTHPDFGIFLSEYDKFIHENFFSEDYQIAYVVDPIQNIEGFYFWINGNLEKCPGFYIYERTGVKIREGIVKESEKDTEVANGDEKQSLAKNIWIGFLSILVLILIFCNMSLSSRVDKLEQQYSSCTNMVQQELNKWLQQIYISPYPVQTEETSEAETTVINGDN